jgi:carboxyl-terminal processing protease
VRKRIFLVSSLLLIVALTLPVFIHAQQARTEKPSTTTGTDRSSRKSGIRDKASDSAMVEEDIAEALTVIQDNYVEGSKLDYNAIFKSSMSGMLHVLDPHSIYFDSTEFDEFRTDQRSEYFGIGATIGDLRDGDTLYTYIRATFPNSPALRAGLLYGDKIVAVNGESMKGRAFPQVREKLRGPRGSAVKVTVERLATGNLETVSITRDAVPQPSIPEAYMIRPGIGYIAMTGGFNLTTGDEFEAAMEKLHSLGMNMLVIDLRGNGGGLLSQAVRVANTFLQRGQLILTQKGRTRENSQVYTAENDTPDQTPIVVLVNRGTASASEIVAGALQDHDRALIVGENSFGKGLVQNPFLLEYGSALLLTIAKYYTPSGRLIQRDYSNAGFYDYLTHGGTLQSENPQSAQSQTGPESRTDTGRTVYGGGGILPDESVKPRVGNALQAKLVDPTFAFALSIVGGHVKGFESYKVQRPIQFSHDLAATDYPMTEALYSTFKDFVASHPFYKVTAAQVDKERSFIEQQLRYEVVTAAYGSVTSYQAVKGDDAQLNRAIELLPRAKELALAARKARNPS